MDSACILTCLFFVKSPWWPLVWAFCAQTPLANFLNEVTKKKSGKENLKKNYGPSNIFKNISWAINICLKYLIAPEKTLRPPSYILNVRSLIQAGHISIYCNQEEREQYEKLIIINIVSFMVIFVAIIIIIFIICYYKDFLFSRNYAFCLRKWKYLGALTKA